MRASWDIFCNVVDNFGDIGVAWRLARGLASAGAPRVRLWVDDLRAFAQIWPAADPGADRQSCEGVEVRAWRAPFPDTAPADVVVEAFGCALPERYLVAMSERTPPPAWINLEYLSAEAWVATHHGLPSPHPRLPLTRHFFFPGYTPDTGGLLAEPGLAQRREAFRATGVDALWRALGLADTPAGALRVSLFAYENPALPALLNAWAADTRIVDCLVPEGRVLPQLADWLGVPSLAPGDRHTRGGLRLTVLPFTDQDAYDRLLWACDLNFVRGEDSCVRAQWASRPMVWQAYPQAERAHWDKVDALLARYAAGLDAAAAAAVRGLWQLWNGMAADADMAQTWRAWRSQRTAIERHADVWCRHLDSAGNLVGKLVEFAENR